MKRTKDLALELTEKTCIPFWEIGLNPITMHIPQKNKDKRVK